MAVVRSFEGTFYDIPADELEKFKVPPDKVKRLMEEAAHKLGQIPGPRGKGQMQGAGTGGTPQILVQFITQAPGGALSQAPVQGEQESVTPQWYWINWANWANWYNWY